MTTARGLREAFTLVRRLGYSLYPSGKSLLHGSPTWVAASLLWCASRVRPFRELLATGIGEARALVDVMVKAAAPIHPPVATRAIEAMKQLEPQPDH